MGNERHAVRITLSPEMRKGMSTDFGLSTIASWLGGALVVVLILFGVLIYLVEG